MNLISRVGLYKNNISSVLKSNLHLEWRTYCPQSISGEANEDTQLTISYACLHKHDEQIFQTFDQFDAELTTQGRVFQTNTVFSKNPSLLKKIIPFGPADEDLGFRLVYFLFGFLFDQLSYVSRYGQAISDSHLSNVFVKDRLFYWGELGISNNATSNRTEAEMIFWGSISSISESFRFLYIDCGIKLGPHAIAVLKSFKRSVQRKYESETLKDFLTVALGRLDVEIAKFPPVVQDKLFFTVGPQLRSSFVILREQQEKQQGKIVTLERKVEGITSNATESQKRIVMLEEENWGIKKENKVMKEENKGLKEENKVMKEDNLGMKSKMEKIEKDLAMLMENQKTAMPLIGDGVGYFVGAETRPSWWLKNSTGVTIIKCNPQRFIELLNSNLMYIDDMIPATIASSLVILVVFSSALSSGIAGSER
eukprot:gene25444-33205_t